MRTTGVPWYHLNSFFNHKGLENALCDWLLPVCAVTGIPVTVYSARLFFVRSSRRLQRCFPANAFTTVSITGILLYQVTLRVLLLNCEIIRA